ncbi:MAG: ABC transporter substrate-binding protein [Thalassotalea sp.]
MSGAQIIEKNNDLAANTYLSHFNSAKPLEVLVLAPQTKGVPFWDDKIAVMIAAADDLNINLEVQRLQPNEDNQFFMTERFKKVVKRAHKPDYFISYLHGGVEKSLLTMIEQAKINFISINNHIPDTLYQEFGLPRQKYKHWLAHISPDDYHVGKALTEELYKVAKASNHKTSTYRMLALSGPKNSTVASQRTSGLQSAVDNNADLTLLQLAYSNWHPSDANAKMLKLMQRHEQFSLLWGISDVVTLGAIQALERQKLTPNKDVFAGGINWSKEGIAAVQSGKMVVSFGGHFLDGAKALILIYDHASGKDFDQVIGTVIKTKLQAITAANVNDYEKFLSAGQWHKIDFKSFSLFENPAIKQYNFSSAAFMNFEEKAKVKQ